MIGLKRFIRPGLVISVLGHVGILLLALILVAANALVSKPPDEPPPDAIPPDAMLVDVVPPNEAPRFEGTPSEIRTSGSDQAVNANRPSTAAQSPAHPAPQQPQQPQQRPNPEHNAQQPTARPKMAQTPEPSPTPAEDQQQQQDQEQPAEAAEQPSPSETFAQLALVGGQLGGGFEAPAIDAPKVAHDFTLAFRERVSSCSALPAGIGYGERVAVSLRVFLNPDGTLGPTPRPNRAIASAKEQALMQSSIEALQKCQPYTMLPPEKYKQWKTLDLVFTPLTIPGR
jgi:hypothetical protein